MLFSAHHWQATVGEQFNTPIGVLLFGGKPENICSLRALPVQSYSDISRATHALCWAPPNWGVRRGGSSHPYSEQFGSPNKTRWPLYGRLNGLWEGEVQHEAARFHIGARRRGRNVAARRARAAAGKNGASRLSCPGLHLPPHRGTARRASRPRLRRGSKSRYRIPVRARSI